MGRRANLPFDDDFQLYADLPAPVASRAKDTHLHAVLQRCMESAEVESAHRKRKDDPARVPKFSRQEIIDIVREVGAACVIMLHATYSHTCGHVWALCELHGATGGGDDVAGGGGVHTCVCTRSTMPRSTL